MAIQIPSRMQYCISKVYEKCHKFVHPYYGFDVAVMLLQTKMCFYAEIMIYLIFKIGMHHINH